jgi:hypothetical protein
VVGNASGEKHLGSARGMVRPRPTPKRYIDFAAANGFRGVLVEGWNLGWDGNWSGSGSEFSFTQSYPDFDLPAVSAYAQQKACA